MLLDPSWSLNRVYIADIPGLDIPGEVKGRLAYELVAAHVLTRLIREQAATLGLNRALDGHALRLAYDTCLESQNPSVRAAAEQIARTLGRNLGYVLLTLKRGDPVNCDARPEWGFRHWDHWAGIERVWLGGGLVSGNLGPQVARHTGQVAEAAGIKGLTVQVSPYAAHLPLLGAARHVPSGASAAVALDFGSTLIKRARVTLENDRLVALQSLPGRPVPWNPVGTLDKTTPEQARELIHGLASLIAETWREAQALAPPSPARTIPVSVAAYVRDGNPMLTQAGTYMQTNRVTDDLQGELGRQVSATLGTRMTIKLLHDGTAAANTYAGQRHTAVITLGTVLGIGFPGDDIGLRPLAADLKVR